MLAAALPAASPSNAALVAGSAGFGSGSTAIVVVLVVVVLEEVVVVEVDDVVELVVLVVVVLVVLEVEGTDVCVVDVDLWSSAAAAAQDTSNSVEAMMAPDSAGRRGRASTMARVPVVDLSAPDSLRPRCPQDATVLGSVGCR
jgi:hypothetical protein